MFPKDSFHHAYFIEGERQSALADVEKFLRDDFGIIRQGHPDVHYSEYESMGIDESRALQDMQSMRPVVGDKKIFIIAADAITSEAQNSLLKVFEEPTPGTHFFVISSSQRILLPTLKSRMVVVSHSSVRTDENIKEARNFLKLSIKDRLAFVAGLIEDKDKARAEDFLQSVIGELHSAKKLSAAKEVLSLVKYLKDRAPSIKLILERAALLDL